MEFGKHIGKGIWGFADKSLVIIYGLGFVFLAVRVLPESEYGAFVMVQAIFNLIIALAGSFALQPLIKFASESDEIGANLAPSVLLYAGFLSLSSVIVLLGAEPLSQFVAPSYSRYFADLLLYLPGLIVGAFLRNIAIAILQTRFQVEKIFVIDAVFFLGSLVLLAAAHATSTLHTAHDLLWITQLALVASSIVAALIASDHLIRYRRMTLDDLLRIWNFGKYSLASSASVAVQAQLDVFFLSAFGGSVHVAIYSAAKIFARIFDVTSQVIQLFVVPASSRFLTRGDDSSLRSMMEKSICFSTLLLVPVFLIFFFGAELVIELFYGGRYDEATAPLRIFAFLVPIIPAAAVFSSMLVGFGKVKIGMLLTWAFLAFSFILQWILVPRLGPAGAALASVGAMLVLSLGASAAVNQTVPVRLSAIIGRTRDALSYIKRGTTGK